VLVWVKEDVCSEHPVVRIGCWLGTSVYTNRLEWVKEDVCSEHPVVRIGCWLGTSVYTNRLER